MCESNECFNSAGQPNRRSTDESLLSNRVSTGCSSTDSISSSVFHRPLHRNPSIPELISVNNNTHQEIVPSRESSYPSFATPVSMRYPATHVLSATTRVLIRHAEIVGSNVKRILFRPHSPRKDVFLVVN